MSQYHDKLHFQYTFQQYFYMRGRVLVDKMFALANQVINSSHADPGKASFLAHLRYKKNIEFLFRQQLPKFHQLTRIYILRLGSTKKSQ